MNDCFWLAITACDALCCKCDHYLSMNSDDGQQIGAEWERKVEMTLRPLAIKFANSKGFNVLEVAEYEEDE